jgi:hypothetical protein
MIQAKRLFGYKIAENAQTTQYTSGAGITTIIDKFTATNYSGSAASISVNLINSGGTAGNDNIVTKTKTLQPAEVYTFPELVGQALDPSGFISTIASAATSINIGANGRVITT